MRRYDDDDDEKRRWMASTVAAAVGETTFCLRRCSKEKRFIARIGSTRAV